MANNWVISIQVVDNNDADFTIHHNIRQLGQVSFGNKIYYVNMNKRGGATGVKNIMLMEA